jgi:hypothetical protein
MLCQIFLHLIWRGGGGMWSSWIFDEGCNVWSLGTIDVDETRRLHWNLLGWLVCRTVYKGTSTFIFWNKTIIVTPWIYENIKCLYVISSVNDALLRHWNYRVFVQTGYLEATPQGDHTVTSAWREDNSLAGLAHLGDGTTYREIIHTAQTVIMTTAVKLAYKRRVSRSAYRI